MQVAWSNPRQLPVIPILLLINTTILLANYSYRLSFEENGSIENAQVFILLCSMIGFLYASFAPQLKPFAMLCTVICFAFLLREIDIEDLNIPNLAKLLFSGNGKYITVLTLVCPTLYWTLKRYSLTFLVRNIVHHFIKFAVLISILFILSWIFDKGVIQTNQNAMLEELCKLNAYMLIFFISILYINLFSRRQSQDLPGNLEGQ
jgi:hypothetical protein